jgi:hypothetical protein
MAPLGVTRWQILAFRQSEGALGERLPRASRRPTRMPGRTGRSFSCGGRDSASSSSPRATWLSSRSARCLTMPEASRERTGEIAGAWRRAHAVLNVQPWRPLSRAERDAVETEAASLPLPGIRGQIAVRWDG